ncbi:MAG: CPBP family intramembrane metalloprotease [Candidatus Niyogibacteria bacterium]|nr:CPBP family intramembrane metalloprotease [Candidatus Niyogibacteria bacterium]
MRRWLETEATGKRMCGFIVAFALGGFVYATLVVMFFHSLEVWLPLVVSESEFEQTPVILLAIGIIFSVVFEEVLFRLVPLAAAVKMECSFPKLMAVIAVSSVIFGYLHGILPELQRGEAPDFLLATLFIFIQGVFGFLLSLVFLKCGGYAGKFKKAFLASTATHILYNSIPSLFFLLL